MDGRAALLFHLNSEYLNLGNPTYFRHNYIVVSYKTCSTKLRSVDRLILAVWIFDSLWCDIQLFARKCIESKIYFCHHNFNFDLMYAMSHLFYFYVVFLKMNIEMDFEFMKNLLYAVLLFYPRLITASETNRSITRGNYWRFTYIYFLFMQSDWIIFSIQTFETNKFCG